MSEKYVIQTEITSKLKKCIAGEWVNVSEPVMLRIIITGELIEDATTDKVIQLHLTSASDKMFEYWKKNWYNIIKVKEETELSLG